MSEKHVEITVSFAADADEVADLVAKISARSHVYLSFAGHAASYPRAKRVRLEALAIDPDASHVGGRATVYAAVIDDGHEYHVDELYATREAAERRCAEKNAEGSWHYEVEEMEVKG